MKNRQQQFIQAYQDHADALFRHCFFKVNDRELAKDLLQETFMRAWRHISKNDDVENIRAFLYKIMGNLIIDEYRKHKIQDSLENLQEQGFDPGFDDTDRWINSIDGEQAVQLLKKIPEPYRDVLFMRHVQDLSLSEIAIITGESENTIGVRIHRGIDKLRKIFNDKQ